MNLSQANLINKAISTFILTVFLFFGLVGMLTGMEMGSDGKMDHCPFTAGLSVCNMTVFEHLKSWQNIVSSVPQELNLFIILMILIVVNFFALHYLLDYIDKNILPARVRHRYRILTPFSHHFILQEEFSQGILNSKLY